MAAVPAVKVYYGKPMLPDVSRVLACLYEKDIEFELVDMYKGQHVPPDFLKLQASARLHIPGFEDGTTKLFESRTICRYVAEKYADRGNRYLLGSDVLERASIEQWLKSEEKNFDPPSSALVFHLAFLPEPSQSVIDSNERKLAMVLDVYEQRLAESKFLAGNEFTLADLSHLPNSHYIASSKEWSHLFDSRENVSRWWKEISDRNSWRKVVEKQKQINALKEEEKNVTGNENKAACATSPPLQPHNVKWDFYYRPKVASPKPQASTKTTPLENVASENLKSQAPQAKSSSDGEITPSNIDDSSTNSDVVEGKPQQLTTPLKQTSSTKPVEQQQQQQQQKSGSSSSNKLPEPSAPMTQLNSQNLQSRGGNLRKYSGSQPKKSPSSTSKSDQFPSNGQPPQNNCTDRNRQADSSEVKRKSLPDLETAPQPPASEGPKSQSAESKTAFEDQQTGDTVSKLDQEPTNRKLDTDKKPDQKPTDESSANDRKPVEKPTNAKTDTGRKQDQVPTNENSDTDKKPDQKPTDESSANDRKPDEKPTNAKTDTGRKQDQVPTNKNSDTDKKPDQKPTDESSANDRKPDEKPTNAKTDTGRKQDQVPINKNSDTNQKPDERRSGTDDKSAANRKMDQKPIENQAEAYSQLNLSATSVDQSTQTEKKSSKSETSQESRAASGDQPKKNAYQKPEGDQSAEPRKPNDARKSETAPDSSSSVKSEDTDKKSSEQTQNSSDSKTAEQE